MIRIAVCLIITNISTLQITYLTFLTTLRNRYYLHITNEDTEEYPNHAALEVSV